MPKFELNFGLGTDRSKLSTLLYSQDSCSRPWVCVCVCPGATGTCTQATVETKLGF